MTDQVQARAEAKTELIGALHAFVKAWAALDEAWEQAEPSWEAGSTMYPFKRSFDEELFEVQLWRDDFISRLTNTQEETS